MFTLKLMSCQNDHNEEIVTQLPWTVEDAASLALFILCQ